MHARALIVLLFCLACAKKKKDRVIIRPYCKLPCDGQGGKKIPNSVCQFKCKLGADCDSFKALPLNLEERQWMLDEHNKYRQDVASGKDKRGGNDAASNMMVLNYDIELEVPAICWGLQCTWGHDECRRTPKFRVSVGQNIHELAIEGEVAVAVNGSLERAMKGWYEEIKHTTKERLIKYNGVFTEGEQNEGAKITHYTQLVWAKTTHVGCARVSYRRIRGIWYNVSYILCDYAPTGNVIPQNVYAFGKPASRCPTGTKPNDKYPALCGKLEKISSKRLFPIDIGAAARISMSRCLIFLLALIWFSCWKH